MITGIAAVDFVLSLFTEGGFNASYHLLAIAYLQVLATGTRGAVQKLGFQDNVNPRDVIATLEKSGKVAPKVVGELKRRAAAHQNAWEMLPMCAAAVVAGNTANLPAQVMNVFMLLYILLRGVYVSLYVRTATQQKSFVRSLVWGLTAFNILFMLFKAGNKLNADREAGLR